MQSQKAPHAYRRQIVRRNDGLTLGTYLGSYITRPSENSMLVGSLSVDRRLFP